MGGNHQDDLTPAIYILASLKLPDVDYSIRLAKAAIPLLITNDKEKSLLANWPRQEAK